MKTVYQTDDGKLFSKQIDATKHEEELKKQKNRERLIDLCRALIEEGGFEYPMAGEGDPPDVRMADYIIHNVREFGIAMSPFIKTSPKQLVHKDWK